MLFTFNASILVRNCTFSNNMNGALLIRYANYLEITDSLITNNTGVGIYIDMSIDNVVRTSMMVNIRNCSVGNNRGISITVERDTRDNPTMIFKAWCRVRSWACACAACYCN